VLLNLAVNARDAMPGGGSLRLSVDPLATTPEFARTHAWARHQRYVRIQAQDSGQGMPEEVQQHIFEPFYTTKEPGKGTGLGLSVVYSIIQNHEGGLVVESRPGRGTSFIFYLPLAEENQNGQARQADEEPPLQGRGQQLLVVDDEISLREISSQALKSFGYRVRLAGDGMEALGAYRLAKEMGEPFDLVILDLAMPVMGGKECLERILAFDPGAKVIIATGQADDDPEMGALAGRAAGLLRKPFNLVALIRQVGEALAPPAPELAREGVDLAARLGSIIK
jgi:CheY-like chemotaxis protein